MTSLHTKIVLSSLAGVSAIAAIVWFVMRTPRENEVETSEPADLVDRMRLPPRSHEFDNQLTLWWEGVPKPVRQKTTNSGTHSNIHPSDYVGPESCRKCHAKNYELWSEHPHRWMNVLANQKTVKGDFGGDASIDYLGGHATFYTTENGYRMRLERGDLSITYGIEQTIGSRFYQYYVGKILNAPPRFGQRYFQEDHVLPFGYWLDRHQWVPVVHVFDELPDGERPDPFNPDPDPNRAEGIGFLPYSSGCNYCHTTFALGDMLIRNPKVLGKHSPAKLHWSMADYLGSTYPNMLKPLPQADTVRDQDLMQLISSIVSFEAPTHAVTMGVSCEACHLGAKEHVEKKQEPPNFVPHSPFLFTESNSTPTSASERRREYINWACGRCHTGARPEFANGISTWNSTEYSDAMLGACYSQMTCVDCHNPHQKIGQKWSPSPDRDDAVCLSCHQKFEPAEQRMAHTHHPSGTAGSRCMNCHMPRINEGLQDTVRTHTIFSPTDQHMIESNSPNACNLCHLDKSIDWTTKWISEWYGIEYSKSALSKNYPSRDQAVGIGWLKSEFESTRLVATAALTRNNCRWAIADLLDMLDDPFLINRQFAAKGIEEMQRIRLSDHGYRFYMTPQERRKPIQQLRQEFLDQK